MEQQVIILLVFFFALTVVFFAIFRSVLVWAFGASDIVKTQKQIIELLEKIVLIQSKEQGINNDELNQLYEEAKFVAKNKKKK